MYFDGLTRSFAKAYDQRNGLLVADGCRVLSSGSTISTLLHDKINPKDCQVLSLGDSRFLQFFRVVSSDYGKPRSPKALGIGRQRFATLAALTCGLFLLAANPGDWPKS